MSTLITIFKTDLSGKEGVVHSLETLSAEIKELETTFVFLVKPGMLIPFLQFLNQHSVSYGTQFGADQSSHITSEANVKPD